MIPIVTDYKIFHFSANESDDGSEEEVADTLEAAAECEKVILLEKILPVLSCVRCADQTAQLAVSDD